MIPYVPTKEAEAACRLINRAIGSYLMAEQAESSSTSHKRIRSRRADRLLEQRDSTVIRIMSITESFCGELLITEYEADENPKTPKPPPEKWEKAVNSATASWPSQIKHYDKWLNVNSLDWDHVLGVAEARNAITHGLGRLTRRQLGDLEETMKKLGKVKIGLTNDRVAIDTQRLRLIASGCIAHVLAVDEAVSTRSR